MTGYIEKVIASTAYHPQTNGLDEKFNQSLVNALTKIA